MQMCRVKSLSANITKEQCSLTYVSGKITVTVFHVPREKASWYRTHPLGDGWGGRGGFGGGLNSEGWGWEGCGGWCGDRGRVSFMRRFFGLCRRLSVS